MDSQGERMGLKVRFKWVHREGERMGLKVRFKWVHRERGFTGFHGERGRVAGTMAYLSMESIAKTLIQTQNVLPTKISLCLQYKHPVKKKSHYSSKYLVLPSVDR